MPKMVNDSRTPATLEILYSTLAGRHRPEGIASIILELTSDNLLPEEHRLLQTVAQDGTQVSLMPTNFAAPASLHEQTGVLAHLLGVATLTEAQASNPVEVRALLAEARAQIGMAEGRSDFKHHRANRGERQIIGLDISRRRYNKLFRLLGRIEQYVVELEIQQQLFRLGHFAKTAFAADISWEAFASNLNTACLVSYLVANLGRRSTFTNEQQASAFDEVSAMLLARCERNEDTNWFVIAHVFPNLDVLARVSVEQRMVLLGQVLTVLRSAAHLLHWTWERSQINLETMIARKGNDTSTWNVLAGAWNKGRDYWIVLMQSLGYDEAFERFMPGKVMRLMAADAGHWHQTSGSDLHGDTAVWATLPKPWDVMDGVAAGTRAQIAQACQIYEVDAEKTGWISARSQTMVDSWRATPELVHGVIVNHPELAYWLRKVGIFSGQEIELHTKVIIPEV